MRLASGYIYEHEYLFTEHQTINFGGKYLYDLELNDKNPYLTRSSNTQFIADFYNATEYETKIELVINMTSIKRFW